MAEKRAYPSLAQCGGWVEKRAVAEIEARKHDDVPKELPMVLAY